MARSIGPTALPWWSRPEPDDGPETPDEIARVLAAMASLQPLDILGGVAADLDAWERGLRQHGIDRDRTGDSPE